MSLAAQVSALATAVGAKIKAAAPIIKHRVEMFGLLPALSSAAQLQVISSLFYFGTGTYCADGTVNGATSTWHLSGHFSGTYSLVLYYAKSNNYGMVKVEISKDNGSNWTTLSAGLDLYNTTTGGSAITYTGISIPEGSLVLLRFTVTGKNAASTAYYYMLSAWELARTGA